MKNGDQKGAYKLFSFSFLVFEVGANRFSIKFRIKFLNNVGMVPRKPAKFENPGQKFSEMSFVIYSRKTEKYLNQTFLQEVDQESCG